MSDPNQDWLAEEFSNLRDLEAPPTLLPRVMDRVRAHRRRPDLLRVFTSRADLSRSLILALSVFILAVVAVINPLRYFSELPFAVFFRIADMLLESAKILLLRTEIFRWPLLSFLAPLIIFSYVFLVSAASFIKRLLAMHK
jgi:hypothetical protein